MSEFEADIDNLHVEMENFLRAVARKESAPSQAIFLRTEYKNNLKVIDKSKHSFAVEESFLSAFRDTYTDKNCNSVTMQLRLSACTTGNLNCNLKAKDVPKYR